MFIQSFKNFQPTNFKKSHYITRPNLVNFNGLNNFDKNKIDNDSFELSNNTEYFDYKQEDYDEIKNSIKKENFIGAGLEGKVFQMKDQNFVVKIPRKFFNDKKIDDNMLKLCLTEEDLTEQDKVNHVTKKFKNGITIMHKIAGKPIDTEEEMNEVANLPVSSYNKLLNQIIDAENKGMVFDYVMNNVLYDKDSQTLTAIDFRKKEGNDSKLKILEKMYIVFNCFKQPHEEKVAGKIISAGLENLKSDKDTKISIFDYDFDKILKYLQYDHPENSTKYFDIKNNIDNVMINKIHTETDYQKSVLDDSIERTQNVITEHLG